VLSTVILPGSAHLVAGRRRVGRIALRTWLAVTGLVTTGAAVTVLDVRPAAAVGTRPALLSLVAVAMVLLAAGWAALLVDAWRFGRPHGLSVRQRRGFAVVLGAALLVTTGPLTYGAVLLQAQRDLIGRVFATGPALPPVEGRYNVLLIGGDAAGDRAGLRPDSLKLLSVDAETGQASVIGIPRNLANAPFPAGSPLAQVFPDGYEDDDGSLVNALYTYGSQHPELYPGAADPGAEATKDAVSGITGLTVQYHVLVDMRGFEALVDAVGGIEVEVGRRLPIGGGRTAGRDNPILGWIEPGRQRLDGHHALWFARSREGSSDYDRMARQRCVLVAMRRQLDPATVLLRFQAIAEASGESVRSDIPEDALPGFVTLALRAQEEPLRTVDLVPPRVDPGNPDLPGIHALVRATLEDPAPAGAPPSAAPASAPEPKAEDAPKAAREDEDDPTGDTPAAVTPAEAAAPCSA